MSSRQRKAKAEKKPESKKVEKARPARPSGKAPEATVTSRHGSGVVTRRGRGFSLGELAGAGLSPRLASGWGLMLDTRRRSVLDANVSSLKSWSAHPGAAKRVEGRVKEVEEEIEKVGREVKKEAIKVEKEAAKVEREAVKVEREAKEEVAKVEKTVRRRARPKKKEET